MADTTLLSLSVMGVARYSARGLRQTLAPIDQAKVFRRTVNGRLIDVSAPAFRKYRSTITGNDQAPPTLSGIWPGQVVQVDCIARLASLGGAGDRTPVDGSSVTDADGLTTYRPSLTMVITDFNLDEDEYGAQVGWTLTLEEQ